VKLGWLFEAAMAGIGAWSCYETARAAALVADLDLTAHCALPAVAAYGAFGDAATWPFLMVGAVVWKQILEVNHTNLLRNLFQYKGRLSAISLGVAVGFYALTNWYLDRL
jgi:hypothetical protein